MRLWRPGRSTRTLTTCSALNDPRDTEPIHLFRALLRQCTYLPDPAARSFFHNYIVARFQGYQPRKNSRSRELIEQRRPALLRTARKGLVYLQRANDGHPRHLGKVLAMTYGRVGKRRHELLQPLKSPDVVVDRPSTRLPSDPRTQGLPKPSRQLSALVQAQTNKRLSFFSRPNQPRIELQIPEKNAWGRPMPVNRVRNMRRQWYGKTIDGVLPPLPEAEWKRLRDLASSQTRWEGPIRRRGQVGADQCKHDLVRGTLVGGAGFVSSPHEITARFMRRLWTKIFAQCPLMKRDASKKLGWDIRWGNVRGTMPLVLQKPSQGNMTMFEGVDESGKILRSARPTDLLA